MKALYDLKDKLFDELEEIARKPEMSAGDLEATHKLTDTIKNIDKICMFAEIESEDSHDGEWEASGNYGNQHSYRGRRRDSMGRYSREGDYSNRGRSRGGNMMEHLEKMMDEATTDKERSAIRRCMNEIR